MDPLSLFGTLESAPPPRRLTTGALSVTLAAGGLGAVEWGGVEVLRAAQVLVRDTDWGTWPEEDVVDEIAEQSDGFLLTRRFAIAGGGVAGRIEIAAKVGPDGAVLTLDLLLDPVAPLKTNRAGLVVLHSAALAGSRLRVRRPDGQAVDGTFPLLISPAQPFRDIGGLAWTVGAVRADLGFEGEVFEMEDQRNWSDGSFKTYCRPLSLPWPYDLKPGQQVRQGLRLKIQSEQQVATTGRTQPELWFGDTVGTMPAICLAAEAGWTVPEGLTLPPVQGLRWRFDLTGQMPSALPEMPTGAIEVELILPDDDARARRALAALAATGLAPLRIAAVPAAFMASHQPDGPWPTGLLPEQALELAASAFPMAAPMGGMLSFFTELNRYPAAARCGASVTFGTAAVVHDAADLAVMQTLGALPAIFQSAAVLSEGRPLRLGLVSIGMRSNPYGASLADNPDRRRRTMTATDPRHRAAFGAAFAVGAMAATAGTLVASLCLGATGGPFGLDTPHGLSPLGVLTAALAAEAGRPRHAVSAPPGVAAVASDRRLFLANLGAERLPPGIASADPLGPYEVRILDRGTS